MSSSSRRLRSSSLCGALLLLACALGGGLFYLPEVLDPLPLPVALGVIGVGGVLFAGTTTTFARSLNRYLDEVPDAAIGDGEPNADFIGSLLRARLGNRSARIIALLLTAQTALMLYGYAHEVAKLAGQMLGTGAIPIGLALAAVVIYQNRTVSTASNTATATRLVLINLAVLGLVFATLVPSLDLAAITVGPVSVGGTGPLDSPPLFAPVMVGMSFTFSLLYGLGGAAAAVVSAREAGLSPTSASRGLAAGVAGIAVILAGAVLIHRGLATPGPYQPSAFLDRISAVGPPATSGLASVYLVGQLALATFQGALALTLLARDGVLNRAGSQRSSLAVLPAVACVVGAGVSAAAGIGGYGWALRMGGVLLIPILGGCVPLLVWGADLRIRLRRSPITSARAGVASLGLAVGLGLFLTPTAAHGLIIWQSTLPRLLAFAALGFAAAIVGPSAVALASAKRIDRQRALVSV